MHTPENSRGDRARLRENRERQTGRRQQAFAGRNVRKSPSKVVGVPGRQHVCALFGRQRPLPRSPRAQTHLQGHVTPARIFLQHSPPCLRRRLLFLVGPSRIQPFPFYLFHSFLHLSRRDPLRLTKALNNLWKNDDDARMRRSVLRVRKPGGKKVDRHQGPASVSSLEDLLCLSGRRTKTF